MLSIKSLQYIHKKLLTTIKNGWIELKSCYVLQLLDILQIIKYIKKLLRRALSHHGELKIRKGI